ncbi:hypothetical protein [Bowmanella yangjiangensis]|uniref:Uncharacterized protein n=1 Tax=Bowmanella yangjiangensis TaxID=2811230 RepID=A0ABS3CQ41_9ALTE|nr:hypothetical protein [Bowmanella yangjiangensis]MBN7819216.1 hypothetical protein [Bowmanella yangjiangensis]
MTKEQRIKEIEKEFMMLGIIDAIPMVMIGLGLYAKFANDSEPVFAFLKDEAIVNGMFIVSVPVVLWCMFRAVKLASERRQLENTPHK